MIHIVFYPDLKFIYSNGANYQTTDIEEAAKLFKQDYPEAIFVYAQLKKHLK